MLSSFTLQMPMNVARSATVIATHVLSRACAGFDPAELSADSSGSISISERVGVERLFWRVRRTLKVQVVAVRVDDDELAIERNRVLTDERDRNADAVWCRGHVVVGSVEPESLQNDVGSR